MSKTTFTQPNLKTDSARYETNELFEQLKLVSSTDVFSNIELGNKRPIDYLKSNVLTDTQLCLIFNSIERLDVPCIKYLIDCHGAGTYKWKKRFCDCVSGKQLKPMHFICKYCADEVIIYALDVYLGSNFNLNCEYERGHKLIHYICIYNSELCINYILDIYLEKGFTLDCANRHGHRPIHYICRRNFHTVTNRILDIYIEMGLDLECADEYDERPIHLILEYGSSQLKNRIISYYLDNGLDIECASLHCGKSKPIHLICMYGDNQLKKRIFDIYIGKYGRVRMLEYVLRLFITPAEFYNLISK